MSLFDDMLAEVAAREVAKDGVTTSTNDAMSVLHTHRKALIDAGRKIATQICREYGTVHSRQVRAALLANGMLKPTIGDYWLGAVFNKSRFRWTGRWHEYSDASRNIHERTVKIWELPPGEVGYL